MYSSSLIQADLSQSPIADVPCKQGPAIATNGGIHMSSRKVKAVLHSRVSGYLVMTNRGAFGSLSRPRQSGDFAEVA